MAERAVDIGDSTVAKTQRLIKKIVKHTIYRLKCTFSLTVENVPREYDETSEKEM